MINLSTDNAVLMREINADIPKLYYWVEKKYGGRANCGREVNRLANKAYTTKQSQVSEPIEYRSKNGNRWYFAHNAMYQNGKVTTRNIYFAYYETEGSIGVFVPSFRPMVCTTNEAVGCTIYNSHFFLRMCERLGIAYKSRDMVMRFLCMLPYTILEHYGDSKSTKTIVRLPGSYGFGTNRCKDGQYIIDEIRTFLYEGQLSGRQKRVVERIRKNSYLFEKETNELTEEEYYRRKALMGVTMEWAAATKCYVTLVSRLFGALRKYFELSGEKLKPYLSSPQCRQVLQDLIEEISEKQGLTDRALDLTTEYMVLFLMQVGAPGGRGKLTELVRQGLACIETDELYQKEYEYIYLRYRKYFEHKYEKDFKLGLR